MDSCIHCGKAVNNNQHALCCDGCDRWQHRLCETGISRTLYQATMRGQGIVSWYCRECTQPTFVPEDSSLEQSIAAPHLESTRLEVYFKNTPGSSCLPCCSAGNNRQCSDAVQQVTTDSVDHEELMDIEEPEPEPEPARDVYDQDTIIDEEADQVQEPPLDASFDLTRRDAAHGQALDASFDLTRRGANDVEIPVERSLQEPDPADDTIIPSADVVFEVLEKGSKRRGKLLVGSDGFTYGVKRENKSSTMWTCSVRSKKMRCPATVLQTRGDFKMGQATHIHAADPKLPFRVKVSSEAKSLASADVFRPAMAIVEDVVMRLIPEEERFLAPKMDLLKRSTNLHRSKVRPTEPSDINFEMDHGFISSDDFLVKDIQGEGFRHIVFATRYQLDLLSETKAWTVYRQPVRTNNDVEGWHHRVNSKAGHRGCSFYKLTPLLLHEAKLVETRVSSENLFRDVRHSSSATQKKLEEAWEQYDAGQVSTGHFLRLCGSVYAPYQ